MSQFTNNLVRICNGNYKQERLDKYTHRNFSFIFRITYKNLMLNAPGVLYSQSQE